jgi:hypothetical protein
MSDTTPPTQPLPATPQVATGVEQSAAPVQTGESQTPRAPSPVLVNPTAIAKIYQNLHDACGGIVRASLQVEPAQQVAESHVFVHELERWAEVIAPNKERQLLAVAAREYQYALLALTQGLYRQAFKGLRLVLELCLQAVHLSVHKMDLQEWLDGRKDTVWKVLVDENNGVLSVRFAKAFFQELEVDVRHHRSLAEQLYRECSECVHGNMQKCIPLPESLAFSQDSFALWHHKATSVALVIAFVLAMRYLKEMVPEQAKTIEHDVLDRLGHIVALRRVFGGPEGG